MKATNYQDQLLERVLSDIDTTLRCEGAMCTHCIDLICENVVPMLRRLQELRANPDAAEVVQEQP